MLRDKDKNLRIEETKIPHNSPFIGKSIGELRKHALLLAIQRKDGSYEYNPAETTLIEDEMSLIFMGSPEDMTRLESILQS